MVEKELCAKEKVSITHRLSKRRIILQSSLKTLKIVDVQKMRG